MSTHNPCFEQKYEKYQNFLSEIFQFLEVRFSIYLNRSVFVMNNFFPTELCLENATENSATALTHLCLVFP